MPAANQTQLTAVDSVLELVCRTPAVEQASSYTLRVGLIVISSIVITHRVLEAIVFSLCHVNLYVLLFSIVIL